ncbi:IBR domain protein [Stachybotrys elegans]|uniref:RBR-type E3 ubiquitin transferase n=1 Tax=Stachybotrys elegans TaxID=80388 RepID=A0A8K0SAP1_9HYPO|nr:IBR domain protein [Stachybotrys elegans]
MADNRVCRSINRAVRQDATALELFEDQERQARADREYAQRLQAGNAPREGPRPDLQQSVKPKVPEPKQTTLKAVAVAQTPPNAPPSLQQAVKPKAPEASQPMVQCTICTNTCRPDHVVQLACKHHYCKTCLTKLFRDSMKDESLFPPRCCRLEIPIHVMQGSFPPELVAEFYTKQLEFSTPNRTYCHRPTCSAFIPPSNIDWQVCVCPKCQSRTCVTCKGPYHFGKECPKDESMERVLRLAGQRGWKQCPCGQIVELRYGCNHITCRCKSEFCYTCGKKWKTCECPVWDEERLLAHNEAIAGRRPQAAAQPRRQAQPRQHAQVRQPAPQQVPVYDYYNDHCTHEEWDVLGGSHECEECQDVLEHYIMECMQCYLQVCKRCRWNRL